MRAIFLFILLSVNLLGAESAPHDYKEFQKKWKFYKIAPSNYSVIVDFVRQARSLEDSELKLASYSFVTLATYLQGEVAAGQRMQNEVATLARSLGDAKWKTFSSIEQFGDACNTCAGEQKKSRVCRKCQGNKRCANKDCRRGKIGVVTQQGGKFVEVEKDCPVCTGSGDCTSCKGTGEYLVKCNVCKGFGFKLNLRMIKESIELKKAEMDQMVIAHVLKSFEAEQAEKGLILVAGKWLTQEEIDKEEAVAMARSERLRLEKENKMMAERQRQLINERRSLLQTLNDLVASDPQKAEQIIAEKFAGDLDAGTSLKIEEFKELAQLVTKAQEFEQQGNNPMAIKFYEKADSMRTVPYFSSHIRKLKLTDIGL